MIGDTVPRKSTFVATIEGAPGAMLRIVGDGGRVISGPVTVSGATFEHRFTVPKGTTWLYAELYGEDARETRAQACEPQRGSDTTYCRNRIALLAMTSAIYVDP